MQRPEKPTLLRWFYRTEFGGTFPFREVLERGARVALRKDTLAAEAYAESNAKSVWSYLLQAQEEDERRGISRIFKVVDHAAMTLSWCSLPTHSSSARRTVRLRHRPAMLSMIDGLTDREYEALACVLLRLVGATETLLTPPGNEGGVDFFALIPSPGKCHLFSGFHPLRIIGQSKKYTSRVQAGRFKEFLRTIDEVKYGGLQKTEKIVPPWFRAARGPIVGVMIAHSGFQSGAESRARQHGTIAADSLDVAEILALSRGLLEHLTARERASDCRSRIAALLTRVAHKLPS